MAHKKPVTIDNGMVPGRMLDNLFQLAPDRPDVLRSGKRRQYPARQRVRSGDCVTSAPLNRMISPKTGAVQGADEGETAQFLVRLEGRTIHLQLRAEVA